jgi:hypothetical protein
VKFSLCVVARFGALGKTKEPYMVFKDFSLLSMRMINGWENFRMSKSTLFNITNRFQVVLMEQETHYRKTISIEIQMACVVYKLAYNMNFLAHSLN